VPSLLYLYSTYLAYRHIPILDHTLPRFKPTTVREYYLDLRTHLGKVLIHKPERDNQCNKRDNPDRGKQIKVTALFDMGLFNLSHEILSL
jgi:hypothetical protein